MNSHHPSDQAQRDRFENESEQNFSVIAPAGVGKTRAVVQRIIRMATGDPARARERLPKLVVVTYTNRAADEMQQRARMEILRSGVSYPILSQFNRAFFGTIHSFCLRLLRLHGQTLGVGGGLELLTDTTKVWNQFVRQLDGVGRLLRTEHRQVLFRHRPVMDMIQMAETLPCSLDDRQIPETPPRVCLDEVLAFEPGKKLSEEGDARLASDKLRLQRWKEQVDQGMDFVPIPGVDTTAKGFLELYHQAFDPLRKWLNIATWNVALEVAGRFRDFRLARGYATYDDQIRLAESLIENKEVLRTIREENYRVILDEAQDTDPTQFRVLLEVTRPSEASNDWLKEIQFPPRPGHFCMVGDPQQSIYGDRADLIYYEKIRKCLEQSQAGESLTFNVTFRCDQSIVDCVNQWGDRLLDGRSRQVSYTRLSTRPEPGSGQVVRIGIPSELIPGEDVKRDAPLAEIEARFLARWIREQGLEKLRAPCWSEVALLCPRKLWFEPLARWLQAEGIPVQIQSPRDLYGDDPVYAWCAAACKIMADPIHSLEIVGVLRELFAISDDSLALFSRGTDAHFRIDQSMRGEGDVARALNTCHQIWKEVKSLPLADGVGHLFQKLDLRGRLASIPGMTSEQIRAVIDEILLRAAACETEGWSWNEWADWMERRYKEVVQDQTPRADAIQLMTSQKAKGLQWCAVILPFIFRKVRHYNPVYPAIVTDVETRTPLLFFEKGEYPSELRSEVYREKERELQRILYVAMTRARRTLVWVDDSVLFGKKPATGKSKKGKPASKSGISIPQADLIGLNEQAPRKVWEKLPSVLIPEEQPPEEARQSDQVERATVPLDENFARKQASRFPKRILPHSLAIHPDDVEFESSRGGHEEWEGTRISDSAIRYGTWWHECMEEMEWKIGISKCSERMLSFMSSSPDPKRALGDWNRLTKSSLIRLLTDPAWIIQREMPILCSRNVDECLEGIVDLVLIHPVEKRCCVLDWKTNAITSESFPKLVTRYQPQIDAYAEVLHQVTGLEVKAMIYSTATGMTSEE